LSGSQKRGVTFTTAGALGKSSLREANDRVVLLAILRNPGISRRDLARVTGLSASAMTGIIDRLMAQGFLDEGRMEASARLAAGRPPAPLTIRWDSRLAIGVEIGPAGTRTALADLRGHILAERRITGAERLLERTHEAIAELAGRGGDRVLGVAVSIPGNLDPESGRVRHATNLAWHDVDALSVLRGSLPLPFSCENNSDLAALAERWFRPDEQLDDFVFVTLRVGLGTGLILNGQLVRGAANRAGEFGHMVLVPGGRPCVCGQAGCWEEYASDRALTRRYPAPDSLTVVSAARAGDAAALAALRETADALAQGLVVLILGLNPAAIVLDDWAAAGWDLVGGYLTAQVEARLPAAWRGDVRVLPSQQASQSSLQGAIAKVLADFFTSVAPERARRDGPLRIGA